VQPHLESHSAFEPLWLHHRKFEGVYSEEIDQVPETFLLDTSNSVLLLPELTHMHTEPSLSLGCSFFVEQTIGVTEGLSIELVVTSSKCRILRSTALILQRPTLTRDEPFSAR
jgi:hypothetical protein